MAERTCPKCSASALRDDQRFCEKCGHRLDSSSGRAGWPIKVGIAVAVAAAIIAGVVLSGGSDNGDGNGTAQPAGTPPPTNAVPPSTTTAAPPITVAATTTISTTTQVPVPEGLVTSILEAQDATIRIDVTGTFHYPSDDEPLDLEGGGSGFIIDPSGLAITNNHVVAGASIIKVYVGEQEVPRSAQVVARSECSDLALIDIAGGGYDYFDWYDGEIRTGQKIYAAGFPLGDPEFTLTGGIVSKDQASAGLDTYWASLKHQIEHDARLNPGNSGGPLLTEDAKVVGVNYSGNESTRQEWAISVKEVLPILDELKAGWDVHSIGINGEAFYDYREDRYGIWVVSVESGTPADLVGLQPGDLITRVENMAVGDDETMANYCDILRSHAMDDVLKLQVYRGFSGEELVGRLNASPLEPRALSSGGLSEFVPDTDGLSDGYSEYVGISDDTKSIFVDIPVEWDQVDGEYSTGLGPNVAASSDLAKFFAGWGEDGNHAWDTPGVMVGATRDWSDWEYEEVTDHLLNLFGGGCTREPPEQYDDGLYVGVIEFASECSPSNAGLVVVGAAPLEDESALTVYVVMKIVSAADAEALINVLDSFYVVEGFEEGQSGASPTTTTPAPSTTSSYSTSATEPVPTTAAPTTQPSVTTSAATTTQPSATTTTQVPSPPSTPRNLTAQVSGTSNPTITLDWDAPTTGGDGCQSFYCPQYRIEQSANGFNWTLVDDNSNYTYKSIYNGLNWGITYTFRVAAVNDGGLGPWTQASIIPSTTPGEPSGVEACRIGDTDEYQVTWSAPTSDGGSPVTSYTIIWGISSYQVPSMSQVITATNSTNIGVYSNNANGPSTLAASVYISSGSTDTCPGTSTTMASTTTTTTTQPPATTTTTTTTQPPATTTTTTTTQPPATTTSTTTTTQPPTAPSARSVIDVSMGYGHICAVLQGGTVKCWGFGEHAQLGYGDTSDRGDNPGEMGDNLPAVDLGTGKTATAITASGGGMVSCALLSDGTVKCWGNNDSGTLGQGLADRGLGDDLGEMGDNLPPIDLGSGRTATVVATNGNGACALLDDGTIKCWGSNSNGQAGYGHGQGQIGREPGEMGDNLPVVDLGTGKTATDIAVGDEFTCALLNDSTIKCWGRNTSGQLGYGHTDRLGDDPGEMGDNLPVVDLGTGKTATAISSGGNKTCALLDDSTVKCWGLNTFGELGYGDTSNRGDNPGEMGDNLPVVDLGTGKTATDISVATWHTCALLDDSTIKCWGRNVSGQLGYGDISNRGDNPGEMGDNLPVVDLGTGKTATAISTGKHGSCALLNDGTLKCWGNSGWGQLGQGSLTSKGGQPGQMGDNLPTVDLGS